jgi:hypothetical protein
VLAKALPAEDPKLSLIVGKLLTALLVGKLEKSLSADEVVIGLPMGVP